MFYGGRGESRVGFSTQYEEAPVDFDENGPAELDFVPWEQRQAQFREQKRQEQRQQSEEQGMRNGDNEVLRSILEDDIGSNAGIKRSRQSMNQTKRMLQRKAGVDSPKEKVGFWQRYDLSYVMVTSIFAAVGTAAGTVLAALLARKLFGKSTAKEIAE